MLSFTRIHENFTFHAPWNAMIQLSMKSQWKHNYKKNIMKNPWNVHENPMKFGNYWNQYILQNVHEYTMQYLYYGLKCMGVVPWVWYHEWNSKGKA